MCQAYRKQFGSDFISALPTNLYGPNDNFDLEGSHVLPALIHKIHNAKRNGGPVPIWGSGTPKREFMHAYDLAAALVHILEHYSEDQHINVGLGEDVSIRELAETAAKVIGYTGEFEYDASKPDGTPRKVTDISLLRSLGWSPAFTLEAGIEDTYEWFIRNWKQ